MKKLGIWMDKRVAYIITEDAKGSQKMQEVHSTIEDFHVSGGSGTAMKGGPQDVVQDSRYLEREKHQFREYANEISAHLKGATQILIFGPAQAGERLEAELLRSHPEIAAKIKAVSRADSMTENQMKAFVREFFKTSRKRSVD